METIIFSRRVMLC